MSTFTCEKCHGTFNKNRPDGDAKAEFEQAPWNVPGDDICVICEECFKEFKVWFASLTSEDHKRLIKDVK